jgi:alcohol dehydrogenase class IV
VIADGFTQELVDRLEPTAFFVAHIDDVVQHVPGDRVTEGVDTAREHDADSILAVGGGSSTGLAKMIARDLALPIIAIPTTFAGSEATPVWGYTQSGRKHTGIDARVLPQAVVYDAELTRTLPVDLASSSAMNALAHAVDSHWAPFTNPINRANAVEGIRLITSGLQDLISSPADLGPRESLQLGGYLAAVSFASAGSGIHHKLCHLLGGMYNLPHAATHASVLPYMAWFNADSATDDPLAAAFGGQNPAFALQALRARTGAPESLAALGLPESELTVVARELLPLIPESNPRMPTAENIEALLRAAWAGVDISRHPFHAPAQGAQRRARGNRDDRQDGKNG